MSKPARIESRIVAACETGPNSSAPTGARFDSPGWSTARCGTLGLGGDAVSRSPNGARFAKAGHAFRQFGRPVNVLEFRPFGASRQFVGARLTGFHPEDGTPPWAVESRPGWGFGT